MDKQKAIIVDLDGTVADCEHRLHHIKNGNRDWDAFFDAMVHDTYIPGSWEKIMKETAKVTDTFPWVTFITGRRDSHFNQTLDWLEKYIPLEWSIDYNLEMRDTNDFREDTIVKKELADKCSVNLEYILAFDDRPRIIEMWESNGIPTITMGEWKEFDHANKT